MDEQLSNPQTPAPETESEAAESAEEILTAPIWPLLFKLSFPAVVGLMLIGLNNFIDALFVGQFIGTAGVAALTIAFPLVVLGWGFNSMLGEGAASKLSRAIGRGDRDERRALLINVLALGLGVGALLTPLGWFLSPMVVELMTDDPEVRDMAVAFVRVIYLGFPVMMLGVGMNMMIRAEGKLARAMFHAGGSIAGNIALNPILIHYAGLGIVGAALATVLSMVIYLALNAGFLLSKRSMLNPDLRWVLVRGRTMARIAALGTTALINNAAGTLQQVLMIGTLTALGTAQDVALFGAAWRLLALPLFAVYGLVRALQPVLGMNYGAGQYARVRESVFKFGVAGTGLLFLIWLPIVIAPEPFLRWTLPDFTFTQEDVFHIRVLTVMLPVVPAVLVGMTMFQALGYARIAAGLSLARQLLVFVPAILLLPRAFGLSGVYYTLPVVDGLMAIVALAATAAFLQRLRRRPDVPQPLAG